MKKTYISPSFVMVQLNLSNVILVGSDPTATVDVTDDGIAPGSFGTKGVSDVNVWDSEW